MPVRAYKDHARSGYAVQAPPVARGVEDSQRCRCCGRLYLDVAEEYEPVPEQVQCRHPFAVYVDPCMRCPLARAGGRDEVAHRIRWLGRLGAVGKNDR